MVRGGDGDGVGCVGDVVRARLVIAPLAASFGASVPRYARLVEHTCSGRGNCRSTIAPKIAARGACVFHQS
jgi:hypothetical protein